MHLEKKKDICKEWYGKKAIMLGILVFIVGLLRYLGYTWDIVLMAAGALIILKGIIIKLK